MKTKDWRENIHELLVYLLYEGKKSKIPNGIINAIDAAYVAGLEDGKKSKWKGN